MTGLRSETLTEKISQRFSENLARCRTRADLSQEELGLRASVHRTEISQLERGLRMPRLDTIIKLAGGLAISPCELLDGMAWRPGIFEPGRFDLT
jgi:transcriptional regulator with XRE-family HTH domain